MDEEEKLARAKAMLESRTNLMTELWGTEYEKHEEYQKVLTEVIEGRTAQFALLDRCERKRIRKNNF